MINDINITFAVNFKYLQLFVFELRPNIKINLFENGFYVKITGFAYIFFSTHWKTI